MTDLEDALRTSLHHRLDPVDAPPLLAAAVPARAGDVRRRRLATTSALSVAFLAIAAGGYVAADSWRSDRNTIRPATQPSQPTQRTDLTAAELARRYAEQFASGDFDSVRADMTASARRTLTVPELRGVWRSVFPGGSAVRVGAATESTATPHRVGIAAVRSVDDPTDAATLYVVLDNDHRIVAMLLAADVESGIARGGEHARRAVGVAHALASGNFSGIRGAFDATMRASLSEERLRLVWEQVVARYGGFERASGVITTVSGAHVVADVVCEFAEGTMKVRVAYDDQDRIAGLYILRLDA